VSAPTQQGRAALAARVFEVRERVIGVGRSGLTV
jgi:hypothetical protein